MTDKEIIIDGVDVAECQYLYFAIKDSIIDYKEYPRCSIGEAFTNNACKNSNCYYKQLKRKEQECDQLKTENKEYKNIINKLAGKTIAITSYDKPFEFCGHKDLTIKQLKAENEELKKIIDEAKNSKLDLKSFLVGEAIQNEYEEQLDQLKAENETKQKALELQRSWIDNLEFQRTNLKQALQNIKEVAEEKAKVNDWLALEILQKINEVEQ